jgi:hypothetical protein
LHVNSHLRVTEFQRAVPDSSLRPASGHISTHSLLSNAYLSPWYMQVAIWHPELNVDTFALLAQVSHFPPRAS